MFTCIYIFKGLLLIGIVFVQEKSLHKKVEHFGSMLGQMDISSLIGRVEASNSGCLGGHLVGLYVVANIRKREGGIGLDAMTLDTDPIGSRKTHRTKRAYGHSKIKVLRMTSN